MMLRLRELRKQHKISQQELADYVGVTQATLSGWENEKYEIDNTGLKKIADFFNISVDYLLGRTDDKNQNPGEENIKFDDFTYAMHNETQDLSDDDKQMLITMARMLKNRIAEKKDLENESKN